jgi:hypothetical protein
MSLLWHAAVASSFSLNICFNSGLSGSLDVPDFLALPPNTVSSLARLTHAYIATKARLFELLRSLTIRVLSLIRCEEHYTGVSLFHIFSETAPQTAQASSHFRFSRPAHAGMRSSPR